jgi:hypothetical protein
MSPRRRLVKSDPPPQGWRGDIDSAAFSCLVVAGNCYIVQPPEIRTYTTAAAKANKPDPARPSSK